MDRMDTMDTMDIDTTDTASAHRALARSVATTLCGNMPVPRFVTACRAPSGRATAPAAMRAGTIGAR